MLKYIIQKIKSLRKTPKRKNILDIKKRKNITLNKKFISKFKKRKNQLYLTFSLLNKFNFFGNKNYNYYIISSLLIIACIIFVIFSPIFKIKIINIIKKDDITNINIAYQSIDAIRGKHIFSIDEKEIFNKLALYQQNIKNIDTDIILPNTLKILIESYKGVFNTTFNNKNYIVTENGTLIAQKNNINNTKNSLRNIKIASNLNNNQFLDYKKILNENNIKIIIDSIKKIEENIINIQIKDLTYYEIERELHITLKNNTILIFNLEQEIENQIEKAVIFNRDFLQIDTSNIIYIDLRIKNKVFYCLKETEIECKKNIKNIYK